MISLNTEIKDLWDHLVLDFYIVIDNAIVCNHYDIEDFLFILVCLGYTDTDWHDLVSQPIDGKFRAILL